METVRICRDTETSTWNHRIIYPDPPKYKKGMQVRLRNSELSSFFAFPLFLMQESCFALPGGIGTVCSRMCTQFLRSSTVSGFKFLNYLQTIWLIKASEICLELSSMFSSII